MTKNSASIIGCGWLGKALTRELVNLQYSVVVSTQHQEKAAALSELGAQVECFTLSNIKPTADDFKLSLFQQSCLIIAIPPMIRQGKTDYPDKIKHIVQLAQAGSVKQLIMISSTAIYNGLTGDVDENAELELSSEKTEIIHQAEQQAMEFQGETIVLRFSGLVGPERHPGKFLKDGRKLSDPNAITNLIHQQDAVGLLLGLINQPYHTAIYNGSSYTHVYKRDYYEKAAQAIGYSKPEFLEPDLKKSDSLQLSKKIISSKIRQKLNYTFQHDDLLIWLENH
ncbi:SDR family NAD(P)-dependent oxidoreductase [Colwellia sp. RE-S-Sl-9]